MMNLTKGRPDREGAFDFFTYHMYCNQLGGAECGVTTQSVVAALRPVLPLGMPVILEETGSSAGPYDTFHDTTREAAFTVPYLANSAPAGLAAANWWVSSDLYSEHSSCEHDPRDHSGHCNLTWIPAPGGGLQSYSGGMPRAEFTGRWGFITPSGIPKPIFRTFELLKQAGERQIEVQSGGSCTIGVIDITAIANDTQGCMVFVSNAGLATCRLKIQLQDWAPSGDGWFGSELPWYRIDATHGNPYGKWESMGSPHFPTPKQVAELKLEAELYRDSITVSEDGVAELTALGDSLNVIVV